MARTAKRLTATQIERGKLQPGMHSDGDGLHLVVGEGTAARRWVLLLHVGGKRRKLGLGLLKDVSLEQARAITQAHRAAVREGVPLPSHREKIVAQRKAEIVAATRSKTVEQVFAEFWPLRRVRLRNSKHVAQWEATLSAYAWPTIGKRPVAEVRAAEIIDLLAPIWHSKPETARRVLQRLGVIFKFAIVREDRERASPCDGVAEQLGRERKGEREPRHHRALPWRDVPAFLKALRARQGMLSTRLCFEFLVLTAARSGEARRALWADIEFTKRAWTVPASRMKAGVEHRVPLSDRALEILRLARAANPKSEIVFPGQQGQPLSDMTFTKAIRDMDLADRATAHGFRSAFKTWASENGVPDLVSEAALAHSDGNKVRAAYNRTDHFEDRRGVMKRWAEHCG
ncbi:MAG: tyrosine-type recombinase/integrase [Hyphomicrobiaceae bacterium]